jgi:hypothetical protein
MRTPISVTLTILVAFFASSAAYAFPEKGDIASHQQAWMQLRVGERIARWAEEFVGTPYDPDPDGTYVTRKAIVADDKVDCMYHVFRSVELALSDTPEGAEDRALDLRFVSEGKTNNFGKVVNYQERFRYAMDMIKSEKWGVEMTKHLGFTRTIPGDRMYGPIQYVPKKRAKEALTRLRSGDIIYFVKYPAERKVGEIIGHMGIIKLEGDKVYLIHASGTKNGSGKVKKVPLAEYLKSMPFMGFKISRF